MHFCSTPAIWVYEDSTLSFDDSETLRTTLFKLMKIAEDLLINNIDDILNGTATFVSQEEYPNSSFYHNRLMSEYFIDILPNGWDTTIDFVKEMGKDFLLTSHYIERYIEEFR